jgi:NAD-dependent dihydropyrimidine dehydrogenase PreA subunit
MKRDIIHINEELCDGCGECIPNCHEGALQLIDGKARLISDLMCDGLGACIGHCPQGAITMEKREAVKIAAMAPAGGSHNGGCPGSMARQISHDTRPDEPNPSTRQGELNAPRRSELKQWPVQFHLVNPAAGYFQGADLLLAADCSAYALDNFHDTYLKGRSLIIACPKLDTGQESYLQKLVHLIDHAKINTIHVLIMEVPCCGGLMRLVQQATGMANRKVPVKATVVSIGGGVLSEDWI